MGVFDKIETFTQWDEDYYSPMARRYYDQAIAHMTKFLGVQAGDAVLDAGCGPGEHSIRVARDGCLVHGIDLSHPVLEEAQHRVQKAGLEGKIRFEYGDLTNLDIDDESYKYVFSWGVIIHIPELERALSELARILKPGGRLALYTTNASAWDYIVLGAARAVARRSHPALEKSQLGRGCWYDLNEERLWVWRIDVEALTRRMESLGFRRTQRIAGSLTEIHCRLKGVLRQLLLCVNSTWYALGLPAGPCVTNLLVFEKLATTANSA
jgi:SAM-dependent methyltransferase